MNFMSVFFLKKYNQDNLSVVNNMQRFPEWVSCQVVCILRGSTCQHWILYWMQENQTSICISFVLGYLLWYYEKLQLQLWTFHNFLLTPLSPTHLILFYCLINESSIFCLHFFFRMKISFIITWLLRWENNTLLLRRSLKYVCSCDVL
jgi:hypothetical protein